MKKKQQPPRLTLKRETIRQLEQPTLRSVVAGDASDTCHTDTGPCGPYNNGTG